MRASRLTSSTGSPYRLGRLQVDDYLRRGTTMFAAGDVRMVTTSVMSCQHGRTMGLPAASSTICSTNRC